jgi:hypothetical protein
MSPFLGVIEATEEAIYNSLFKATTTTGNGHTVDALPVDRPRNTSTAWFNFTVVALSRQVHGG